MTEALICLSEAVAAAGMRYVSRVAWMYEVRCLQKVASSDNFFHYLENRSIPGESVIISFLNYFLHPLRLPY